MTRRVLSKLCRPFREWPARDQEAWEEALSEAADDISGVAHWSAATRRAVVTSYGRWLTCIDAQGELDPLAAPAARVTPERVARYIAELRATVGLFTVALRIEQLGYAMRALAPDGNWYWLRELAKTLMAEARAAQARARKEDQPAEPTPADPPETASPAAIPFEAWPAPDQAKWLAALEPGDILEPDGVASGWAPTTRTMVMDGYGHWLACLAREGLLDPEASPESRATAEAVSGYISHQLATVAPYTAAARVQQLADALRAMAPQQDWSHLLRAADRIRASAKSVRNKRDRLQSPEQLVALGMQLMAEAEAALDEHPCVRAACYRDGLLIAFLAHRPVRRRNLASMQLGRHLVCRGAEWWVAFPAAETKTKRELAFPFPAELVANLTRYLEHYRPVLAARGCRGAGSPAPALWVSKCGTQMGEAAIAHQVADRTRAAFGVGLSPHLFRDCAATAIAISAPEQVHLIRPILGHGALSTSERHYNLAGSLEASRRYGAAIQALRRR